jgi:hypothetical protein
MADDSNLISTCWLAGVQICIEHLQYVMRLGIGIPNQLMNMMRVNALSRFRSCFCAAAFAHCVFYARSNHRSHLPFPSPEDSGRQQLGSRMGPNDPSRPDQRQLAGSLD